MNKAVIILASIMFTLTFVPSILAETYTIQLQEADIDNTGDASVYEDFPNNRYGSANQIIWRDWQSSPFYFYRSQVRFNLTKIPVGADVIESIFAFNVTSNGTSGDPLSIYHIFDGSWNESTIAWSNQSCGTARASIGGNCNNTREDYLLVNETGWHTLNITNMVKYEMGLGNNSVSFLLEDHNETYGGDQTEDRAGSKEWSAAAGRPYINVTYNYVATGMALDASPSWTTSQRNIIITCSYNNSIPLQATLLKDGIIIPNPFSAVLDAGSYNFTCYINETGYYQPNYIENNLTVTVDYFQCTNTSTFAFTKNLTGIQGDNLTLDFTAAVNNHHIKDDMGDIYTTRNAWINTTGGYYFTINVTGLSSISVWFGNFLTNNSYSLTPNSENVTAMTAYSQDNSYYIFTTHDEMTDAVQLPPSSNVSMTIYCSSGQTIFDANSTRILIPTFNSQLSAFRSTVNYPSDYYTRDYLVDNPVESRTIYDADAYDFSVLQIPIYINDYSYYDSKITIYKTIDGSRVVITEGYFDNEHKFVAYLIRDEPYYIRLTKGSTIREAGFFKPVTAGSLTINLNTISLTQDIRFISDDIMVSAINTSETNMRIVYNDSSGGTNSVRIRVYNRTNQSSFFDNTYTGSQSLAVNVPGLNFTEDYYTVVFSVGHDDYGNSDVDFVLPVATPKLVGFGIAPTWIYGVCGFIMMLFMSFMITPKDRFVGLVMLLVGLSLLASLTWTFIDSGILMLILVFAAVSSVYEVKRGGFI